MTVRGLNEDPGFRAEFDYWCHAGADPELIAMVGPLLRGELQGGSATAAQAAAQFLYRQSKYGAMRDLASLAEARLEAAGLMRRHGQEVDLDLVRRYAPSAERVEQLLDDNYGRRGYQPIELPERQEQPPGLPDASMQRGYQPIELANQQPESEPRYADNGPRPYWEYE